MEEAIYYTHNLINEIKFKKGNTKFNVPLFNIHAIKYRKSEYKFNLTRTESKYIYLLTNNSKLTSICDCNTDLINDPDYNYDFKIKKLSANNNCIELIKSNNEIIRYNLGFEFFNYSYFNANR